LRTRTTFAFQLAFVCTALFVLSLIAQPFIFRRFQVAEASTFGAEFEMEFNQLRLRPGERNDITFHIKNVSPNTWFASKEIPFTVSYRWYDTERLTYVPTPHNFHVIPAPVRPQDTVTVRTTFVTPNAPGRYLLSWDISRSGRAWFSANGSFPGLVEVDVESNAEGRSGRTDLSRWYEPDRSRLIVADPPIYRMHLWKAALQIWWQHPIVGIGPDNFRLVYGRYLGLTDWNSNVRSDSLYLELLADSGVIGLLAFGLMISRSQRIPAAPALALGIFLLHGIVDAFLMTTSIYFAFWILLGFAQKPDDA
jgi:hypothetical protein